MALLYRGETWSFNLLSFLGFGFDVIYESTEKKNVGPQSVRSFLEEGSHVELAVKEVP